MEIVEIVATTSSVTLLGWRQMTVSLAPSKKSNICAELLMVAHEFNRSQKLSQQNDVAQQKMAKAAKHVHLKRGARLAPRARTPVVFTVDSATVNDAKAGYTAQPHSSSHVNFHAAAPASKNISKFARIFRVVQHELVMQTHRSRNLTWLILTSPHAAVIQDIAPPCRPVK